MTNLTYKPSSVLSHFSHVQLFATLWTLALQAPLSTGFSRQEYWSGLLCPSPGDLSKPGTEPMFPALAGRFFNTEPPGKLYNMSLLLLLLLSLQSCPTLCDPMD